MGVLGWPPSEFWAATMFDLAPALEGYAEKNGAKKKSKAPPQGADALQSFLAGRVQPD
jgi:hypothetical protein